jgi:hypothetical protein
MVLVVAREVVLLALLTELRADAKPESLEIMEAEDGCSRRARPRLRTLTRMLLAASLSASTLEVWGWFDIGLRRRPDCARFEGPLPVGPVLEYVGGLRRSSTGTSISGNHQFTKRPWKSKIDVRSLISFRAHPSRGSKPLSCLIANHR